MSAYMCSSSKACAHGGVLRSRTTGSMHTGCVALWLCLWFPSQLKYSVWVSFKKTTQQMCGMGQNLVTAQVVLPEANFNGFFFFLSDAKKGEKG